MNALSRLLAVAVVGAVAAVPADASRAKATPPLGTLLARHVPILALHPAERVRPVAVDGFLADSDLQKRMNSVWENVPGPLPSGAPGMRLDQRLCRAIEGVAATSCYVAAEAAHASIPVVYGAAFRKGSRIDLQYWLWYPWNGYSPTVPAGELWQVHEGDWEAVSVIVDLEGRPWAAGYSQHGEGELRDWARVTKQGARPLVYVALGSHANYFRPGKHRLDPRSVAPELISIIEAFGVAPVDHTGKGRIVRPRLVRVSKATPSWMAFAGAWGEDGYVHFPDNAPLVSGLGPRGPAFHEQWRRPVVEALSWPRN